MVACGIGCTLQDDGELNLLHKMHGSQVFVTSKKPKNELDDLYDVLSMP